MKTKLVLTLFALTLFTVTVMSQNSSHIKVIGKGKPILLFPGFGCTGEVWNETVATLAKNNECHIFTFAGFGNIPAIEKNWFSTIKKDVENYVEEKKLKKSILIGHSIGGTLSLWLASDHPDWFQKIILVDALPCSAALMIPNYKGEIIPYDNPQSKSMLNMTDAEFQNMNNQTVQYMCGDKEKQKLIASWINQADRKTYVYGYIDMLNLDLRNNIAKIKVPVTILAATNPSVEIVAKTYTEQFKKLPSVTVLYAENAKHFVMFDQPEWFMKQITKIVN